MNSDDRVAEAATKLRTLLADRAADVTPPIGLADGARARNRVRRRVLAATSAAAALVVGVGVPAGLSVARSSGPVVPAAPTAAATSGPNPQLCLRSGFTNPQPSAAIPLPEFPRQTGVRGSLAGDAPLVRLVLATGWRAVVTQQRAFNSAERRTLDPRTLRLQFVERAGPGFVALVTVAATTGEWHDYSWVTGIGDQAIAAGGEGTRAMPGDASIAGRMYGADPLYVQSQVVCGQRYGVVLVPRDATATYSPGALLDADATVQRASGRPLPLRDGLALVPVDSFSSGEVIVRRGGAQLAVGTFGHSLSPSPAGSPEQITHAMLTRAVAGVPGQDLKVVAFRSLSTGSQIQNLGNTVTAAKVLWAGADPATGRMAALGELTLSGGARLVSGWAQYYVAPRRSSQSSSYTGFLPADRPDSYVYAWGAEYGTGPGAARGAAMYAAGAVRAEVLVPGHPTLTPTLKDGGALVDLPSGVQPKDVTVRLYDASDHLLGERVPDQGLLQVRR
jgi:hypothetical protein